jgi:hypothetical protein
MRVPTIKKVQRRMLLLANTISSLTRRQLKKGKPVSYGVFNAALPPNTILGRTPTPFSGGN